MADTSDQPARFGTFTGVFTPTLLTILGVIMYVRIGWVVGNGGLLGAFLIMGVGLIITVCTGLSLSSIATNTRLGAGGPYAMVSRSLGLEVAGSVGIPLYLTRPLGIAMYIFGFREGIQWLASSWDMTVPALIVDLVVFAGLFALAFISADLAFTAQYLILVVIVGSLISIFMGAPTTQPVSETVWVGEFANLEGGTDFWGVFAVFFPATTGILAGANMSGELKDSRKSIAYGTLAAIAVSTVIYFALAWWVSRAGDPDELVGNYNVVIDNAWIPGLVFAGLLGATASSALAGLVGGPRILMAMARDRLVPASDWLGETTESGEPRNAALVTGLLTLGCLMMRDLNAIAPLVTMFFLITYCIVNVIVLFEQSLGLVSFRPSLRLPIWVPLVGTVGSIFAMFVVNPTVGLLATAMVVGIYIWIDRTVEIAENSTAEARSSVFVALAEFAATRANPTDSSAAAVRSIRAWKPNMLVPLEDPEDVRGVFDLLCDATLPEGSIRLLGVATPGIDPALEAGPDVPTAEMPTGADVLAPRIEDLRSAFTDRGLRVSATTLDTATYRMGVSAALQALQSAFFSPNLLFLSLPGEPDRDPIRYRERVDDTRKLIRLARRMQVGTFLVARHPQVGLGQRRIVTVWVRSGDWDVAEDFHGRNLNLALLFGFRLANRWGAVLRLVTVVEDEPAVEAGMRFLNELVDRARLPTSTQCIVELGTFAEVVRVVGVADLNILGLQPSPDFDFVRRTVEDARSTCLFVVDSGRESALV